MSSEHMTLGVANSGQGAPLTRAVGALLRALASSRRARSYSLFSDSSFTAASQISSLLGLACRGTAASAMSGARYICKKEFLRNSSVRIGSTAELLLLLLIKMNSSAPRVKPEVRVQ